VIKNIALGAIRADTSAQPRAAIFQNVVDEYAEALADGVALPPVVVFYDEAHYWLADGFHRHAAHMKIGASCIAADVRLGTLRDAILYSVGANQAHGLRRTNDDKRRAVLTLLNDEEWSKWSAREIARHCGVSADFAARLKSSLSSDDSEITYTTKHGITATMNTAAIGKPTVRLVDPHQAREHMDVSSVDTRTDTKGRSQPAHKASATDLGEDDNPNVAAPETLEDNILHAIGGMNENARVFKRLLRIAALDREAAIRISTAIDRAIQKWRSIQSTLNRKGYGQTETPSIAPETTENKAAGKAEAA